jgi:hypothetical protein
MNGPAEIRPAPTTQDALELLRADHACITALFADHARAAEDPVSDADRSALVGRIGALLSALLRIEEELFYPALGHDDARARAEHDQIRRQLETLAARTGDGTAADEGVSALAAAVRAHREYEERELYPLAGSLDLSALGARMAVRRGELLGDQGVD